MKKNISKEWAKQAEQIRAKLTEPVESTELMSEDDYDFERAMESYYNM